MLPLSHAHFSGNITFAFVSRALELYNSSTHSWTERNDWPRWKSSVLQPTTCPGMSQQNFQYVAVLRRDTSCTPRPAYIILQIKTKTTPSQNMSAMRNSSSNCTAQFSPKKHLICKNARSIASAEKKTLQSSKWYYFSTMVELYEKSPVRNIKSVPSAHQ